VMYLHYFDAHIFISNWKLDPSIEVTLLSLNGFSKMKVSVNTIEYICRHINRR